MSGASTFSEGASFATWRSLVQLHEGALRAPPQGPDATLAGARAALRSRSPGVGSWLARGARIAQLGRAHRSASDRALCRQIAIEADRRARFEVGLSPDHALGLIAAAVPRLLGFELHPVQLAAALVLLRGGLAELATGEGKTVTAALAAIVRGWERLGCHVVTVNDYLATRDAGTLADLYAFCGLEARALSSELDSDARRAAYAADVTYATHKELCADFVRDRLALRGLPSLPGALANRLAGCRQQLAPLVTRGLRSAIVDEADSVLVDDAVTPLLISADAGEEERAAWLEADRCAARLDAGLHYVREASARRVCLTESGLAHLERLYAGDARGRLRERVHRVRQSLVARCFYHRDERYVVREGRVAIVDESTGRLMPDRSWRDGLHQAIEAKEGLEVTAQKGTQARLSFQHFFRQYPALSGMTGTAWEARAELARVYGLPVVCIPSHRPVRRKRAEICIYPSAERKWEAVVDEVRRVQSRGRPVLVGTRTIQASARISECLREAGLAHELLNANRLDEEARIVSRAGEAGRITVATYVAGRGTDIALDRAAERAGGLHVIATEMGVSGRIDRQLHGRAGRQGDPGSAVTLASLDDELFEGFATPGERWLLRSACGTSSRSQTCRRLIAGLAVHVQRRAERRARQLREAMLSAEVRSDELLGFAQPD